MGDWHVGVGVVDIIFAWACIYGRDLNKNNYNKLDHMTLRSILANSTEMSGINRNHTFLPHLITNTTYHCTSRYLCQKLPQFDSKLLNQLLPNPIMQLISLLIRQRTLQAPIINTVAHARPALLGMRKMVNQLHVLDQITANITDNLHDIVLMERDRTTSRRRIT